MKTMYKAQNLLIYRVSDEGEIQFRDTTMELGWKRSEFLTLKAQQLGLPAQEILDKEARRQGWIAVKEALPNSSATSEEATAEVPARSKAVELAEDVLDAVRPFKGELTADGCRQTVGKRYTFRGDPVLGDFQCSPRGVKLAPKGEEFMDLTWAKFIEFCKENGLIEEGGDDLPADPPEICRGCQCVTCGNKDCVSPCWTNPNEVSSCEYIGPVGIDCKDYQPIKEESIKCNTKLAQKPAAAANTETPAVLPQGKISTTSESEEDAEASTPKPLPPDAPTNLSAPASPADAGAATQSLSAAAPASSAVQPFASSAFDYAGLDVPTVDALHWAEREICDARRDYVARLAQAVYIAHDALCGGAVQNLHNSKHGNRGDDSFVAWCSSVGFSRRTAYNLLQVASLLNGSTPEEQAVLESASPSLLYAAAKPSAPAELVQGVKDGDITTHKQYQELLARLKAKEQELADVRQEAALDRKEQEDANAAALRYKNEADRRAEDQQRLEGRVRILQDALNQSAQESKEKDARIAELEARPVEVVGVDPDEIQRRAEKLAEEKTRELRSDMDQLVQEHDSTVDALNAAGQQQDALTLARVLDAVNACEDLLRRQFEGLRHADYDRVYVPATDMMENLRNKIAQAILDGEWPREEAEE